MVIAVCQFGEYTLDVGRFELCRNGLPLPLEPKPMELLILLAERNGQLVTRAEIAERLWDRAVFVDTEHGINTAIRKIRYALRDDPEEPRYIQTVTGKGYRFAAPITVLDTGSPPPQPASESLLTNGSGPAPLPSSPQATPLHPRWLVWAISTVLLLLAATLSLAARSWIGHNRAAPIHSLAVLPLDNLSGDPSQEYFADGMTDELTTMLARDSTLRIVSRTSVMQYKEAHRPLREIARALGVDGIVEGSVARSGGRVHMTLQLIQANADAHLWADSYDRDADDVGLPDEAARAIAQRLQSAAPVAAPARYVNPAAHDAYLQGKYLWFSDGRLGESGKYFQKAIEIQPDYAMGWAWRANYYGAATVDGLLDPRTSLDALQQAADRAVQLDPNLAEAHQAMAGALWLHRWDFAGADREIMRAISLDPHDAELYHLRSKILVALNRPEEALESEKKGMEINPFERPWGMMYFYGCARRYDDAIQDGQLRLRDYPTDQVVLALMANAYRCKGMYREAIDYWARFQVAIGEPEAVAAMRRAWERGGPRGFIAWQLARNEMQAKSRYVSPVELAFYHALLGEREHTLALLNEGYNQHSPDILYIQTDPAYDFLHSDPRYRALIRKIGLPPAW
ncbi:MAG: winged helix-turn-helix domain-containing protein [Acidobacteriaceae bacterium]